MEWEFTVVDRHGRSTPVIVEATERATVAGLRTALADVARQADVAGPAADPAAIYLGERPLDDDVRLADAGVATGATLYLGRPKGRPVGETDRELAVIGGPAAGASIPLPAAGTVVVGRAGGCDLSIDDPEVSRRHAELRTGTGDVGGGVITLTDADSRNGTARRGFRIGDPAELALGDVFQVGETVLAPRRVERADAHLSADRQHGVIRYNRPPRIRPPVRRPEVTVPAEPEQPRGFRFPLAMVVVPLIAAAALFAFLPGSPYYLIFLALSPVMALGHYVTERRGGRKEYKDKLRTYHAELAAAKARLDDLAVAEERTDRDALPDPAAVVRIATTPGGRLFERRPADPDFLRLRAGLVDRPADVRLTGPGANELSEGGRPPTPPGNRAKLSPPTVYAVPVPIDLAEAGVLGIAGPRPAALANARAILAQAATLHAPHDLGIALITGSDATAQWEWLSWLPHTLPHRAELACRRMVATELTQAEARIAELGRLVAERRGEQRAGLHEPAPTGRRLLVVLDGARRLRGLPGLADLLADGPGVGVYALCLDTVEASLPDECQATIVITSPSGTRVQVSRPGMEPDEDVLADGLPPLPADEMARALAPIRVLGARFGDDEGLPGMVRYLDLTGLGTDPSADDIAKRWAAQPGGRSTKALLGVGPTGPVEVDLRRDGPHALVAGTSGAGKSELLQTLVASLALGNPPDALNVVLVDYKGGSAFAECRDLPHCVGLITDLDGHLVNRALASLSAELRRREAIFAEAGAKDIEDYWALNCGRLPRLVIVIDEFASLVEEVPEFVSGVVGIGMRGRSLGVHVVLATQRPGGVVNAELRANVNLRICLRVTSTGESTDVIDVPDAARISRHHPGRAYLRTGHSDLAILQSARIGRPRIELGENTDQPAADSVAVRPRRVTELGAHPLNGHRTQPDAGQGHDGETDLTVFVAAIKAAAEQVEVGAPAGPWLPPLPDRVTVAELTGGGPEGQGGGKNTAPSFASPVAVPLGLADHPARQAQSPFVLDLEQSCPVVVAGMARSGRSTALRTLAAALATRTSPADVHIYALDYGSRTLASLAALPHCGAWVDADEPDRAERLLTLLTAEVARRQRLLSAGGYGSLREQRAAAAGVGPRQGVGDDTTPSDRPAYLVLFVDQYETFLARHAETDGGRLVDVLESLLRRGPAVGILPVLATDRSGFGHRLAGAVATRLVLRQAEADQVSAFGLHPREVPRLMPPGRAVAVPGAVELQLALLEPDPEGAAQTAAVERLGARLARHWDGLDPASAPHRVDPLPETITAGELAGLRVAERPDGPAVCTIGAGGDHLAPVDLDIADAGSTLLISGPPRSGRSSSLAAIATSLAGRATGRLPLIAVCPRPSPLRDLAGLPGVADVVYGPDLGRDLEDALQAVDGPVAVVVDDAELLADDRAAGRLEHLARTARDEGGVVVAAGTTEDLLVQRYRGWLPMIRRSRCGVLLNPASHVDGEVFDLRLPRSTCGGWPPGRGLLVWRGEVTPIQVPLADPVESGGDRRVRQGSGKP
jgi:S-DNA-T family DNA segregation ATPase FtsK/SpoIIIE